MVKFSGVGSRSSFPTSDAAPEFEEASGVSSLYHPNLLLHGFYARVGYQLVFITWVLLPLSLLAKPPSQPPEEGLLPICKL